MSTFVETELLNWNQIFELNTQFLHNFLFRGQSDSKWNLETSIERACNNFLDSGYEFVTKGLGYSYNERWMLHEFKRKYPLFSSLLPKHSDNFEWLAIMQHHGAPTRLLDFTHSMFVATFFSTIDSISESSSIWAINRISLKTNLLKNYKLSYNPGEALKDEVNDKHIEFANQQISNTNYDLPKTVIILEPKICSERLARQQGIFVMPTDSRNSFVENLKNSFLKKDSEFDKMDFNTLIESSNKTRFGDKIEVLKINIPRKLHSEILTSLNKMNITAETLFPGLDGLAKSLQHTQIRIYIS